MKKDPAKKLLNEEDLKRKNPYNKKPKASPIIVILVVCLSLIGAIYVNKLMFPKPGTGAWGKITSPRAGTKTSKEVNVTAETKNLESGQYVWLAVDKPEIGLCWPKMQVKTNTHVKTKIFEEGSKGVYALSLYVLPKTINNKWEDWLDKELFGGVPMLPDKRRLDSVMLVLGK